MIIKNYELNKGKQIKVNIFLFYGENEGYKNQIIKEVFLNNSKSNIDRYEENEILNNLDNFISDLTNKSFFEDSKIIIVSRVSEKIIKLVNELVDRKINDTTIILNANLLDKRSKLRSLFEKDSNLVCVPFYKDNDKSLSVITNDFFKKRKLSVSQEIVNIIVERSSGDRINLNNELNKIFLYSLNKEKVNIEDVLKLTNLAENYSVSELADNCLSKNIKKINKIFNENTFSVDDCILIVRTLLMKTKRLLEIKKIHNTNKNLEEVILKFKPPIFWKDKEIVKSQASKWNLKDTQLLIKKINDTELKIKKNYNSSLNILSDFILNTAR